MDRKTLDDTSKFLSYVLRHQPEAIGLTLDG
ncbi:RNA--NAD 2'-phosphotransferase, partial [Pseudomonas aeruginosa]|nr:RNA--NAD 2'-phosphotransferase [Pseudomonas aeruginosa]